MKKQLFLAALSAFLLFPQSAFGAASLTGDGSASSPWQIGNQQELQQALDNISDTGGSGEYFLITDDIHLSTPLKVDVLSFEGFLDGGGNTIYNLESVTTNTSGGTGDEAKRSIFDENHGTIQNLTLQASSSYRGSSSNLHSLLVNSNWGTIENCSVFGNLTLGSLNGNFGMLAGVSHGSIKNCSVSGQITVTSLYSGFSGYVGGIAGGNAGTISNCRSSVNVKADYNVSAKSASNFFAGGIAGRNARNDDEGLLGLIENCQADTFILITADAPSSWSPYNTPAPTIGAGGITGLNAASCTVTGCTVSGSLLASSYFPPKEMSLNGISGSALGIESANTNNIGSDAVSGTSGEASTDALSATPIQNLAPDGRPNCIICGNSGWVDCYICHGSGEAITGNFLENWVGKDTCGYCHGAGKKRCVCGR